MDVVTEVLIIMLPVALVWMNNIQVSLKLQVFLAFGFRLPLIALSASRLTASKAALASTAPQFDITSALVLQQVALTWSLISATLPNLTGFMKSFSIGMGVALAFMRDEKPSHDSNTYQLHALAKRPTAALLGTSTSQDADDLDASHPAFFRADRVSHQVIIKTGNDARSDDGRTISRYGSQDMIIKREVRWDVKEEQV